MQFPLIKNEWLYPESLTEAAKIQIELASQLIPEDDFNPPSIIAGADVSNNLYDPLQMTYAGIVNLQAGSLQLLETAMAALKQSFPYRTGFLGFREVPVILQALQKLTKNPDIILVDGHGISHPRGLGIATHLGVLLNIPTIGVAKSILVGKPATELGPNPGDFVPLVWKNKTIGILLRSKKRSNPLIISTGHRVSLTTALEIVMNCLKSYRLPEPTRLAHKTANDCRLHWKISS